MKKNRPKLHNFLICLMFAFYSVVLFAILFRRSDTERIVNFVPFGTISNFLTRIKVSHVSRMFVMSNLLGNIILFIPLGIYLSLFNQGKGSKKSVFWVFSTSLLVEIVQYTFKMGTGDIDDVILNTFGGWIGVWIYKILYLKLENEKRVKRFSEIVAVGMSFLILILYLWI